LDAGVLNNAVREVVKYRMALKKARQVSAAAEGPWRTKLKIIVGLVAESLPGPLS
jgi:hypothetical protein